jgi:hypothetical protein
MVMSVKLQPLALEKTPPTIEPDPEDVTDPMMVPSVTGMLYPELKAPPTSVEPDTLAFMEKVVIEVLSTGPIKPPT